MPPIKKETFFKLIMMNNKSCIGFYVGFSLFAIQTIAGDLYRDNKQQQHNNKMKLLYYNKK